MNTDNKKIQTVQKNKLDGGKRVQDKEGVSVRNVPLISIVTIVFNGEKYIEQTINSVIGQSVQNYEYIVVDGGSTDGTLDILKKYNDKIDYWLSEPDKGISDAFNKGIALCKGEWIGIINADDWYELDTFNNIIQQAKVSNSSVIYGDMQVWKDEKKSFMAISVIQDMKKSMSINHPSIFVKRDVYNRLGMFSLDYKIAMDYEFLIKLIMKNIKFDYLPRVLSNFREGGMSDTAQYRGIKEVKRAKLQNKICSYNQAQKDYYFAIIKAAVKISMKRIYLTKLVDLYSSFFSKYKSK
jgi:glycosyltransferase involved in cell wall biosynthesis